MTEQKLDKAREGSPESFRGKSLIDFEMGGFTFGKKLRSQLAKLEEELSKSGYADGTLFYLEQCHQDGESLRGLASRIGVSNGTVHRLFHNFEIPVRSQAEAARAIMARQWQDEGYRERQAEFSRATLSRQWQKDEFRSRQAEAARASLARTKQDEEYWRRHSEGIKAKWQDEEFRKRNSEISRNTLARLKQDEEFRKKNADGVRAARLNPENIGKYVLPTIYGERWDVGYARSAWEANLARVIRLVGRDYLSHEPLKFQDGSTLEIDFLTIDKRGRMVAYEIMAHPLKDPVGWEKLEKAIVQYPEIIFRVVGVGLYKRLQYHFAERVDRNSAFAGWEAHQDNLRDNPTKFASKK